MITNSSSRAPLPYRDGRLLVVAGIAALVSCIPKAQAQTHEWLIECVDCPRFFANMTNRSIAVDGRGFPHIVYGGDHLYHAWCDSAGWHTEVVDDSPGVGRHASLCVSRSECLHVAYADWPNRALKYAVFDRGGWDIQTVDTASAWRYIRWPSVAVAADGAVHMTYHDAIDYSAGSRGTLIYARLAGGQWTTEIVDGMDTGSSVLCLGSAGQPMVAYDFLWWKQRFAVRSDTGWVIETLPLTYLSLAQAGFVLDSLDRPHLALQNHDDRPVYAHRDETGWQLEVVDDAIKVGCNQSMALDSVGNPVIAFTQWYPTYAVSLARRSGTEWSITSADTTAGAFDVALSLESRDRVHLCYTRPLQTLAYALYDGTVWQSATIDSGRAPGLDLSLALDPTGQPHLSYADEGHYGRRWGFWYSHRVGDAWVRSAVEQVGNQGFTSSLALDAAGIPHIAFVDPGTRRAHHLYLDDMGWHDEVATPNADVRTTGIATEDDGEIHLVYALSASTPGVGYAVRSADGWQAESVALLDQSPYPWALCLDADAGPHIMYLDYGSVMLRGACYAYRDSEGWHVERPAEGDLTRWGGSLALDAVGRPHTATHRAGQPSVLEHSYKDETGWHTEVAAADMTLDGGVSLGLRRSGDPVILFRRVDQDGALRPCLAWKDAAGWHVEPVPMQCATSYRSPLVVDGNDVIHIAYDDEWNKDVMYATLVGLGGESASVRSDACLRLLGPVPCTGRASFLLMLPSAMPADVAIFDLLGRRLRLVSSAPMPGGTHLLTWDGIGDGGIVNASGAYVCRARLGGLVQSVRFVLLR